MTSLGGADRAIIRMKASRAVCSLKTGVSAGGGGRTVVGGSSGGRDPLSIGVCAQIYSVKDLSHRVSGCSRV